MGYWNLLFDISSRFYENSNAILSRINNMWTHYIKLIKKKNQLLRLNVTLDFLITYVNCVIYFKNLEWLHSTFRTLDRYQAFKLVTKFARLFLREIREYLIFSPSWRCFWRLIFVAQFSDILPNISKLVTYLANLKLEKSDSLIFSFQNFFAK